jgi:nucleoside-triphosphatase THEP1
MQTCNDRETSSLKKNLFLLGNIGAGKSTLIKNALVPCLESVGGFFVQRVIVNDIYYAFRLLPVTTAEEYILDLRQERLNNTKNAFLFRDESGNWKNSMDVFSTTGIDCLENANLQNK